MKYVIDDNDIKDGSSIRNMVINAKPLEDRTHWFKQMETKLKLPEDKTVEHVYIQFKEPKQ